MRLTQSYYTKHQDQFNSNEKIEKYAKQHYSFHGDLAVAAFLSDAKQIGLKTLVENYKKKQFKPTKYIIKLMIDAKASNHKFAICSIKGTPLYCGTFLCSNNAIGDQAWSENEVLCYAIQEVGKMLKNKHIAYRDCTLVCYSDNLEVVERVMGINNMSNYCKARFNEVQTKYPIQTLAFHIRGEDNFADGYTYLESKSIDSDYMSWWKLVEKWI